MRLRLIKASEEYQKQISDMLDEWYATGEKIIPYAIRRIDYHDFTYYCRNLENKNILSDRGVTDSTFFCLDEEMDMVVGAVNIRHYLNESLLLDGGHIGDGVRPTQRGKGIATKMIALALEECKKLGIYRVLMVCDKDNVGSAKSIINNGGILEDEPIVDGIPQQRYWIDLTDEADQLPKAEMVIANLLIEYIGYECFQKAIQHVKPKYVSCMIQINMEDHWVSDSPYLHVFDGLEQVHHQMEEHALENAMLEIDYHAIKTLEHLLPNGKKLVQMDFGR